MGNYEEDTDQNFRTILFLVLFSFFVLCSSNIQGNHYPSSTRFTSQTELAFGSKSSHHNAIICTSFSLPDFQKYYDSTPLNTSLNPFSIQNKILDCNRRIAQNFSQIQKTRLTIEPLLLWRLHSTLSLSEKEDLSVLS